MKVDFDAQIVNLAGAPFEVPAGKDAAGLPVTKPMTLGWVCVEALLWYDPAQPTLDTGEQKARCAKLSALIYQGGERDISIEDAALIKAKIGAHIAHPLVVGGAFAALEQSAGLA